MLAVVDWASHSRCKARYLLEYGPVRVMDIRFVEARSGLSLRHIPNLWEVDCITNLGDRMDYFVPHQPCWNVLMIEELSQSLMKWESVVMMVVCRLQSELVLSSVHACLV